MITRRLQELWTIYRLQHKGVRLDLKSALLRPAPPLYQATARSVPGFGLWSRRVLSVAVHEHGNRGFVQARWRSGTPVLDLLFIAPALDVKPGAAWLWQHLLQKLVRVGGERQVQRLFAHLPEQAHAEIEVMRQAGFAIYTQDRLLCLQPAAQQAQPNQQWVPREPTHDWGLSRLYNLLTPNVVQQAESMLATPSSQSSHGTWWGSRRGCYVLPGDSAGEVLGYLRLTKGEHGHWLKLVLHPEQVAACDSLLYQALDLMDSWSRRPLYCDVRAYEGDLLPGMQQVGFEEVMSRMLLVRHTTAHVRVARTRPATLESAPETIPTPF